MKSFRASATALLPALSALASQVEQASYVSRSMVRLDRRNPEVR